MIFMLLAISTVYYQGQAAISLREVTPPLQGRTHLNSLGPIFGSQSTNSKAAASPQCCSSHGQRQEGKRSNEYCQNFVGGKKRSAFQICSAHTHTRVHICKSLVPSRGARHVFFLYMQPSVFFLEEALSEQPSWTRM